MTNGAKEKIVANILIDAATIIYIIFLCKYNKVLYGIQAQYASKIVAAWHIVCEPDFFWYFILGAVFALVLILVSLWDFRTWREAGILETIVSIILNLIVLVVLLKVYSNPVFTAFVIVLGCIGFGIEAMTN